MGFWEDGIDFLDLNGDLDFEEFIEEIEQEIRLTKKIWTTKDGREIKIKDMSTEHIINTFKMIIRNSNFDDFGKRYLMLFLDELKGRCNK